jgi:7-cyano-7-deazaguanine synthase
METVIEHSARGSALVVFSGGQDSTTCLAWALSRFEHVDTVGFDYGQRHAVELEARKTVLRRITQEFGDWGPRVGCDYVIQLDLLGELGRERFGPPHAQVSKETDVFMTGRRYIPGRNLIFMSMAAVVAVRMNIGNLVCGVSETEYSGYPDCTDRAVRAMEAAINASMGVAITLHAPLMLRNKAGVWALAEELGGRPLVTLVIEDTHTCYSGVRNIEHPWGRGCGECKACGLRSKGYMEYELGRASIV